MITCATCAQSSTVGNTDSVDMPRGSRKKVTLECHCNMVAESLIAHITAKSCAREAQTNRLCAKSTWTILPDTAGIRRQTSGRPTENWRTNAAPASKSVPRSQMILRPVKPSNPQLPQTGKFSGGTLWLTPGLTTTRVPGATSLSSVQAPRLDTVVRLWRSLSGNCESEAASGPQRKRDEATQTEAGLKCSWTIRVFHWRTKLPKSNYLQQICISPLVAWLAQSGTRMQEDASQRTNACPDVWEHKNVTIRRRPGTRAWKS